jgi:hypothetical protein
MPHSAWLCYRTVLFGFRRLPLPIPQVELKLKARPMNPNAQSRSEVDCPFPTFPFSFPFQYVNWWPLSHPYLIYHSLIHLYVYKPMHTPNPLLAPCLSLPIDDRPPLPIQPLIINLRQRPRRHALIRTQIHADTIHMPLRKILRNIPPKAPILLPERPRCWDRPIISGQTVHEPRTRLHTVGERVGHRSDSQRVRLHGGVVDVDKLREIGLGQGLRLWLHEVVWLGESVSLWPDWMLAHR